MTYKSLLLHLANDPGAPARRETAVAIAARFQAKLIGLAISAPAHPLTLGDSGATSEIWAEMAQDSDAKAAARARAFEEAMAASGVAFEARVARAPGLGADAFALHARYADLSIAATPGSVDDAGDAGELEEVLRGALFESGRPLLALPATGLPEGRSRDALLAWDGRKEAARAAWDGLPLLQGAEAVEVCTVETLFGDGVLNDGASAAAAEWLAAHGVTAASNTLSRNFGVASALIERVKERGSDLLVMGGYGHSRLSEAIFGGVTETLLRDCPVPIFMAH